MSAEILLGYAAGIITLAAISGYPENFKPTVTENPRVYILLGTFLAIAAVAIDLLGGRF